MRNNKLKFKGNKKGMVIAASVCILGIAGLGSLSYFSDGSNVTNEVTIGGLDLEVTEDQWGPDTDGDGQNVYPGYTVKKNPTVQNITGKVDNNSYIRATVTFLDDAGNRISGNRRRNDLINQMIRWDENGSLVEGTKYTSTRLNDFPTVNPAFTYIADKSDPDSGLYVYYLNDTLASAATAGGGESVTLFNTISLPTDWSQSELDILGDFKIDVKFEGIQEKSFDNVYDAMAALDKENVKQDYEATVSEGK